MLAHVAPAAPLLPSMAALAAFIVALGLVVCAKELVGALFQIGGSLVGWVPWLGGKAKASLHKIEQRVNNYLSRVVAGLETRIAATWHGLARLAEDMARATLSATQAAAHVLWYVTSKYSVAGIAAMLARRGIELAHEKAAGLLQRQTITTIRRTVQNPTQGRIGAAIRTQVKTVAVELDGLRGWTLPRVKALERAATVTLPRTIAGLRARDRALTDSLGRLWARVRRHDRALAGLGAVALVAAALARIGAGWVRCTNVRRTGKAVCGLDPNLLDALLLGTLAIAGNISIVELTRALQAVTGEVADAVDGFIRED